MTYCLEGSCSIQLSYRAINLELGAKIPFKGIPEKNKGTVLQNIIAQKSPVISSLSSFSPLQPFFI
jgi:hypothetical protein